MSIVESLGMKTPDELRIVKDCFIVFELAGFNVKFTSDIFDRAGRLKKILDDKNELLESMIDEVRKNEKQYESTCHPEWKEIFDKAYGHIIKLIENVCYPLKWPEIQELLK